MALDFPSPATTLQSVSDSTVSGSSGPDLNNYDVAIVGGGIVGLTLATALGHSGLQIALIEAQVQSAAVAKGQAYNISPLSSQIFADIGIWNSIQTQVAPYYEIALSDANYPQVVHFHPADLGADVLGYVAEHQVLQSALLAAVHAAPNIHVLCPATVVKTEYKTDTIRIELASPHSDQSLTAQLLVAADGNRSPLRQAAGIQTQGWKYRQSCVVAFIKPEQGHGNIAYERFWPSGPFAILPLANGLCRIVWTADHQEAQRLLTLNEADFMAELQSRYGDQMGQLTLVGERFAFPVQLQQSVNYIQPRLALIGDAAHSCHPVGGQGLNLGIRDAAALADVLMDAHQRGCNLGELQVLQRYERWRKPENLVILAFTDFLVRCFSNQYLPLVVVRRLGLRLLAIPPFKTWALRLMTGFSGRLPKLGHLARSNHNA
jgi:2-octaprenyl-6-methoxyphenol hydroxylase